MSRKPLCIDLFCGLGGWTEGFLAEGWDVVGFDIEQHVYGEERYPAQLVLQDVRTIHGKQFKDADMIVASSPCQAYSYMAMPWTRAKQIARALRGKDAFPEGYAGYRTLAGLNELFEQPARIQREACEAAGRFIPMIQENVKGAQPWVGPAAYNYGSFYLWGDVPALMPTTMRALKGGAANWRDHDKPGYKGEQLQDRFAEHSDAGVKNPGFRFDGRGHTRHLTNPAEHAVSDDGVKGFTPHGQPLGKNELGRRHGSKSKARKAASAKIAKIPFPLASHIARVYYPRDREAVA